MLCSGCGLRPKIMDDFCADCWLTNARRQDEAPPPFSRPRQQIEGSEVGLEDDSAWLRDVLVRLADRISRRPFMPSRMVYRGQWWNVQDIHLPEQTETG